MSTDDVVRGVTDTLDDFCTFTDEARVDDFMTLFLKDGCFDPARPICGHEKIRKLLVHLLSGWSASMHHLTNVRVRPLSETEAEAMSSVYAWHQRTDGSQYESWGRYLDRLRLDGDRWRFVERRVEMAGYRGVDDQGVRPVPRMPPPYQ